MLGIGNWWNAIGLQRRLQILLQGAALVVLLAAQFWLTHEFEQRALAAAMHRTTEVADGAINGLNTLMDVTIDGKDVISDTVARALFIRQIGVSDGLKELRIVRAKGTDDEYGPGLPEERPRDEMDRRVLASGKVEFARSHEGDTALMRAVIPFIGMKEFRTSKCLGCHAVDEGAVLGAASVTVDISEDLASIAAFNRWLWVGQAVVQVLLFGVIGLAVKRSFRQLGAEPGVAADLARSVAAGDLGTRVALQPNDRDSLMAQLDTMQKSLAQVVGGVRERAEGVAKASAQIARGNGDLSARTDRQAATLEQTAAAMQTLGQQVRQNAGSAEQANDLARGASQVALQGGQIVGDVVQTMKGINEASHRIADIIGVIDGIAFQTNILALNAAVEAARAGEHGRGFAVVAAEVRSLAGRSADAAKEIKQLIGRSVERVEQGTVLVDRAGDTIREMVASIQRVADLIGQISQASAGQSQGVEQVGQAIAEMDQVTQSNATMVQEMAGAADALRLQAQELVHTVSVFKLATQAG
ncbi:methyl-accepting chemotaxis protein [Ideonella sp. A 288]|uniref:methyl-accepting chemotaxis protein n=1 Tax=Ideonella sp. A 288 TaxID=1962181 RepID=UPI001F1977B4|nr:methyl-accepting chemotaxis protein [Ideonella sp. A 288]